MKLCHGRDPRTAGGFPPSVIGRAAVMCQDDTEHKGSDDTQRKDLTSKFERAGVGGEAVDAGEIDEGSPALAKRPRVWVCVLGCVVAAASHSVMSFAIKLSFSTFPSAQILFSRYLFQISATTSILAWQRHSVFGPRKVRGLLFARGVCGMFAQWFHVMAVARLPLADAVSLHSMYPVFTALIAPCALGETLTAAAVVAAIVGSVGCALIARGRTSEHHVDGTLGGRSWGLDHAGGVGMALLGALFASFTYMLIRRLMANTAAHVKPEVVIWCYSATALLVLTASLPMTAKDFVISAPTSEWLLLLAVGGSSVMEQRFATAAFKGLPAGAGTLLLTMESGFAFIFGVVALKEDLRVLAVLGACCIASAVAVTAMQRLLPKHGLENARRKCERVPLSDPVPAVSPDSLGRPDEAALDEPRDSVDRGAHHGRHGEM